MSAYREPIQALSPAQKRLLLQLLHDRGLAVPPAAAAPPPINPRLVAYLVPTAPLAELTVEAQRALIGDVRHHIRGQLPDYMMPAAFEVVDRLPLTPSGKVDRKALAAQARPGAGVPADEAAFVAPRTPVEAQLAAIWRQLLHLQQVSVHDDFFALGGDSILSLQVVTQARQAGLLLSPQQIFQQQTIARLSALVASAEPGQPVANNGQARPTQPWTLADPTFVSGDAPLTPIQHYWASLALPNPHIYHQLVFVPIADTVNRDWLRQALQILPRHHDALRLRYRQTATGWTGTFSDPADDLLLLEVTVDGLSADALQQAAIATITTIERALHLDHGPVMGVALLQQPDGACHLLWLAHHLVVDWVSWRILLADLETLYGQLAQGQAVQLLPKTTSFQSWARWLQGAGARQVAAEAAYWASRYTAIEPLPVDLPAGEATLASQCMVVVALSPAETQALLQQAPAAYGTQINDLLLTALLQTFVAWSGQTNLLLELEHHGREPLTVTPPALGDDGQESADAFDLSRTVGWFTIAYPVRLTYQEGGLSTLIPAVKQQLRNIPHHGHGFGLLRYLHQEPTLAALPLPAICFNYLGQFDGSSPAHQRLATPPTLLRGTAIDGFTMLERWQPFQATEFLVQNGHARTTTLFDLELLVVKGQLRLFWLYSANVHRASTVEALAAQFMDNLRKLIVHCQQVRAQALMAVE
jgi:non-ribosomal peptide synthase protein (TIGR01720 family)